MNPVRATTLVFLKSAENKEKTVTEGLRFQDCFRTQRRV